MRSLGRSLVAASLGLVAIATVGAAQNMRDRLRINLPQGVSGEMAHFPRGAPGTSTGSPIAFGANLHDFYVGVGFQAPLRYSNDSDGGGTVGFGLGNARESVGLDVSINALSTVRSGVGNRMSVGAKLHKLFEGNWGIAAGVQGAILNGKKSDDPDPSVFAVVSKVYDLRNTDYNWFQALTISAGAGTQGFRLEKDIRANNDNVGFFGSAALKYNDRFSLVGDWLQDLSVGVSFVPFTEFPLVITVAEADLTGTAGVHNRSEVVRPRTTIGAGFAFRY